MSDANIHFPLEDGEDAVDKYEELLFEDKKYFTTKPIHPVLFKSRLTKMHKREVAYRKIIHEPVPPFEHRFLVYTNEEGNLLENFRQFQGFQNSVFQGIYAARSVNELEYYVRRLLESYLVYSQSFDLEELRSLDLDAKLGQPLDLMLKLKLLKQFEELGGHSALDLIEMKFDGQKDLLREFKRLSLLAKLAK